MRVLTGVLLVLLAALHQSACADERRDDPRTRLGRALLRRAKLAGIIGTNDDITAEDSDTSGEDQEEMMKEDAAEDIFVGSQSDQHSTQATKNEDGETEGNEDEKTENANGENKVEKPEEAKDASGEESRTDKRTDGGSGDGGQGGDNDEDNDDSSASGADDGDEDDDDDDEASGVEDGSADTTEQGHQNEATENDASATSEQQLTSKSEDPEDAETRSAVQTSGSGAGNEATGNEEADSSGSEQEHRPEEANTSPGKDTGSERKASNNQTSIVLVGPSKEESEDIPAARRSDIEISSGGSADDDETSAAIIQKGVESLSRLLSPVASGLDFTLYSGSAVASETEDKDSEGDGEDESGQGSEDLPEVKIKQCKQVCGPPMSFHECAIPRCELKMGTIKDLCFWLCEHQKDVCRQECE